MKFAIFGFCFVGFLVLNAYIVYTWNLTAGLLSPANYFVYLAYINKPYTKLYAVMIGVGLGFLFDYKFGKTHKEE